MVGSRATYVVAVVVVGLVASCAKVDDAAPQAVERAAVPVAQSTVSIDWTQTIPDAGQSADDGQPSTVVATAATDSIVAFGAADATSTVVARLANPTAAGGPLVFLLTGSTADRGRWIEVLLPIRPNGTTGWIKREDVTLARNPFRIVVDRSAHRLQVFEGSQVLHDVPVAIGTGATPTPVGDFYIVELLRPDRPDGPYGPFAFGLSGFSETAPDFAGGNGVIGLHGTNEPATLGRDVSHGCVRVHNDVVALLAGSIPLGTPVSVR